MLEYTLIRSARRTLAIQISSEGEVIVRAPRNMSEKRIRDFLMEKSGWIYAKLEKQAQDNEAPVDKLSSDEVEALYERAERIIPERVKHYAPIVGVRPNKISIKNQKTMWGSCSCRKNLSFNVTLMLAPLEVIDCIVVHELCHLLEMNHSWAFYREVYRVYPEYDKWHRWLKEHEKELFKRVPR